MPSPTLADARPSRLEAVQFLSCYFVGTYFTLPLGIGIYTTSPCQRDGRVGLSGPGRVIRVASVFETKRCQGTFPSPR